MAANPPIRRALLSMSSLLKPHHSFRTLQCIHCVRPRTTTAYPPSNSADTTYPDGLPRWQSTPERMKIPMRHRGRRGKAFRVNTSSELLDHVYVRFLGPDGDRMLTEEVKWLAVTHKSFDQGRRGFCDRLAYMGKRITELQTSIALVQGRANNARDQFSEVKEQDTEGVEIHPALRGLKRLHRGSRIFLISKGRMANVARSYGLKKVVRWTPKYPERLDQSGIALVIAKSLYAIIGAVALQRGGDVAAKVVRERVLGPLGIIQ